MLMTIPPGTTGTKFAPIKRENPADVFCLNLRCDFLKGIIALMSGGDRPKSVYSIRGGLPNPHTVLSVVSRLAGIFEEGLKWN
jgi:hypothetical protein